jgi:hypothetical protein
MKKIIHRFCKSRIRKIADDCFLDCCCCSCSDPLLIRIFSFRASLFWVLWVVSICGGLFPIRRGLIVFGAFCGIVYLWVAQEVEQMLLLGSVGRGWGICSSTVARIVSVRAV